MYASFSLKPDSFDKQEWPGGGVYREYSRGNWIFLCSEGVFCVKFQGRLIAWAIWYEEMRLWDDEMECE